MIHRMTTAAPRIETERLVLRAHRVEDFAASFAMWSDPIVTRFIGGKPSTEQQAWMRILTYAGLWKMLGYGYWAVEEKATGEFAGEAGLADFHRAIEPRMRDAPESGWAFQRRAHGQGYATEAVRAILAWSDANLAARRTVSLIGVENRASIHVAEKCGYRLFAESEFLGEQTSFFERVRT